MSEFTIYEKMQAAEREVRLRRFSRRKALEFSDLRRKGLLPTTDAHRKDPDFNKIDYQIRCMQEIADEYRAQWDGVIPELSIEAEYMA